MYNVLQKIRSGEALNAKDKIIHDQGLVSVLKQLHDDLDAAVFEAYGWDDLKVETQYFKTQDARQESFAPRMLSSSSSLASCVLPSCVSPEQELLTRLVALNHERAAEEKRGLIRYLRPDFQCGGDHRSPSPPEASIQEDLAGTETPSSQSKIQNQQLVPAKRSGDGSSILNPSSSIPWPESLPEQVATLRKLLPTIGQDPEALAACFGRKNKKRTDQITAILATLKALGHI